MIGWEICIKSCLEPTLVQRQSNLRLNTRLFFSCLCFTFPTMPEEQQNSIVNEHDEHESEQSEEEETENQVDNVEQGKDSNK